MTGELRAWTARDEARRAELTTELGKLGARRDVAVQTLAAALTDAGLANADTRKVIAYADRLRDALEPFDSGERPATCVDVKA